MTIDNNDKYINVCVQEMLYEHLAAVFINMLVAYAKNVVILHDYTNNVGKAVKLQFIELFNGFKLTTPTLLTYSESQLMCLHYVMLTKQNLDNVYEQEETNNTKPMVEGHGLSQQVKPPKKTTRAPTRRKATTDPAKVNNV